MKSVQGPRALDRGWSSAGARTPRSASDWAHSLLLGVMTLSMVVVYEETLGDIPYWVLLTGGVILAPAVLVRSISGGFKSCGNRRDHSVSMSVRILRVLWVFIVISWAIGLGVGLGNGYERIAIMRNFFGFTVYALMLALLVLKPSVPGLVKSLIVGGVSQILVALFVIVTEGVSIDLSGALSISEFRALYSVGFICIFPIASSSLFLLLCPNAETIEGPMPSKARAVVKSPIFALVSIGAALLPSMSKGFLLGAAALIALHICTAIASALHRKIMPTAVIVSVALVALGWTLMPAEANRLLLDSFSVSEQSNATRHEQRSLILSETTLFGNGLGAPLRSGYARHSDGYGFELTYFNLAHKLGVFMFPLILSYLVTVGLALSRMVRLKRPIEASLALGCMLYLIPGIGNPILLAPTMVVLHCAAMYLLIASSAPIPGERLRDRRMGAAPA